MFILCRKKLNELVSHDLVKEQSPDDWKRVGYFSLLLSFSIHIVIHIFKLIVIIIYIIESVLFMFILYDRL